jgi:hypothetical protein
MAADIFAFLHGLVLQTEPVPDVGMKEQASEPASRPE